MNPTNPTSFNLVINYLIVASFNSMGALTGKPGLYPGAHSDKIHGLVTGLSRGLVSRHAALGLGGHKAILIILGWPRPGDGSDHVTR